MKFESQVVLHDGKLDCSQLFADAKAIVDKEKEKLGVKRLDRGHMLQHLINSTSAGYLSPTAMKSFMQCPANYVIQKVTPRDIRAATTIGSAYHKIMELWYSEDKENRTEDRIYAIADEFIKKENQEENKDDIYYYIKNYLKSEDYLGGKMKHEQLDCSTEQFFKSVVYPLGVKLPAKVYCLVDRIDFRDDGIYVIDYKTGRGATNDYIINGYLPQMIFYKWVVEAEIGEKIKDVYLCSPGDSENPYVKMNVNSLVEQSKVIDNCFEFLEQGRAMKKDRVYETRRMTYCASCPLSNICSKYNKEIKDSEYFVYDVKIDVD